MRLSTVLLSLPLVVFGQSGYLPSLMNLDKIFGHLEELQNIADRPQNRGSRAVYLGYNESVDYVLSVLGNQQHLTVTTQTFPVQIPEYREDPKLAIIKPEFSQFILNTDFLGYNNGGSGNIERAIQVVSGGCDIDDFRSFTPGKVALINRGSYIPSGSNSTSCSYRIKIDNAAKSGASGILVYNPNDILPTLGGANDGVNVPVFGVSSALATYLTEFVATGQDAIVNLVASTQSRTFYTINVIAETKQGRSDSVIVVGSHLDSVPAGPGINDNGSGSAANLEMAIQFSKLRSPVNKVRFIWFAAEEWGLLGSEYYVKNLSESEKKSISLNINFDMIASPNYIRGIYDGRAAPENIRKASTKIQTLFEEHFTSEGLTYKSTPFTGRSDYGPFIDVGIPAGGLFTGAEEKKTVEERNLFGGSAYAALDTCYHLACDDLGNINKEALIDMTRAAASVVEEFAFVNNLNDFLNN